MRYFNTAGPCYPDLHYMIPAEDLLHDAQKYIESGYSLVVHMPHRIGKTTTLLGLARRLNTEGNFLALSISCETAEVVGNDVAAVEEMLLSQLRFAAELKGLAPELLPPQPWPDAASGTRLEAGLVAWAQRCPRPLVLLFDEIGALWGDALRNVLRQLRAGSIQNYRNSVHSVVLSGLRDVQDYHDVQDGMAATTENLSRKGISNPFSTAMKFIQLGNFSQDEVARLYRQHTADTGQEFDDKAIDLAFRCTQGQPWLVNAMAWEILVGMSVHETITLGHVELAKKRLILSRATHLDSLTGKLNEPRVRRVIEPIITGDVPTPVAEFDDDVTYTRDLGLIDQGKKLRIANPIYQEVILSVLADSTEASINVAPSSFRFDDGRIDFPRLLREFASFWMRHGDVLAARDNYHESAAQLVLMGYLHRIVNGAGHIDREIGVGRGRVDLLIRQPYRDSEGTRAEQREAIEIKVWAGHHGDPLDEGLAQLDGYLDRLTLDTGTLVVFDRRPGAKPIPERTEFSTARTPSGRTVTLLRA
ncbi:ATP-binding protein [Nocardia alni]|uniref:ATP-binding protein n=1 Tax=Nocardia alni TaxID=2815723 RepID=UPI001C22A5E1|nr:ATP-binding protein [Nocardia alni]